jgi:hypothetical protein
VADYRPTSLTASNACAPRRVSECFDVTIIPSKDGCTPKLPNQRQPQTDVAASKEPLGLIGWLIPERSLLRNIIDCVIGDVKVMTDRLTDQDGEIIGELLGSSVDQLAASSVQLDDVHLALCHARGAVLAVLQGDFGTTRCQLLRATAEVTLAPPARQDGQIVENRNDYLARAQQMAFDLVAAWVQGVIDCICRAFLPRCPDNPCDERVELACVTVKAGKILSICNHSCRKYAGAFPSTFYWMSLVPLIPLFARLLAMLCCRPDLLRKNSPLVNDLLPLLDQVDPSGTLRRKVVDKNFALPRRYVAMAAKFADTPVIPAISAQLERMAKPSAPAPSSSYDSAETNDLRAELAALRQEVSSLKTAMATSKPAKTATGGKVAKTKPAKPSNQ